MGYRDEVDVENVTLESYLPAKAAPDDVRYILSRLDKQAIIIIDEIDRIRSQTTKTLLADTIKSLSDHGVKTTLILIGVADSVDQLIKEHRSVERALVQVHMPRMSAEELYGILDKGSEAGISFDKDAKSISFICRQACLTTRIPSD
jgi:Cdc6-like AAA superfamily ATPase